jgi:hypothetical protein
MVAAPKIVITSALGAFYLWMAYTARHPAVDTEYESHFLRRTASCWVPKSARAETAALVSLQFGDIGYPDACRYLRLGWWDPEHWGVWSYGDKATLRLPLPPDARAVAITLRGSPEPGHTVRTRFTMGSAVVEKDIPPEGTTTVTLPIPQPAGDGDLHMTFSSYTVIPAIRSAEDEAKHPATHPMTRHVGVGLIAIRPIADGSRA